MRMEQDNLSFEEARIASSGSCVFTTHTPVHAAIDLFSSQQVMRVFPDWVTAFGISAWTSTTSHGSWIASAATSRPERGRACACG